ncbi:MAG: aspartate--tRNA(Asn) ligase [Firmicutes bacterium]|nr:aspartate--tRNA(Asn) ligase [Bacillota bacterium]
MEFVSVLKPKVSLDLEQVVQDYKSGALKDGDVVSFKCFVYNVRVKKNFSFVIVRGAKRLFQCFFAPADCDFDIASLKEESAVLLTGKVVLNSPCKINPGFEVAITAIEVLSEPPEALPFAIYKSGDSPAWSDEVLFDNRALTLRNPYYRAILKVCEGVLTAFRDFMRGEDFTEFVPPKIVEAGAEGGADMFSVDYFGKPAYLTQSPQMYKQAMVGVFCKAFCVSPVFRAEKHSTSRHINEFEGLDLEMGFIDSFEDLMALETRMMAYIFDYLRKFYADELKELGAELPVVGDIPKIRFADVKELIKNEYNRPYRDEVDLEPEEERLIGRYFKEKFSSEFVFITHYPTTKRPFYAMDDPADTSVTLSFDLLLNGAEITTGGQRIHDYNAQVAKMRARGMNPQAFSEYLAMHRFGLPPHGGMGIGLERFVMRILKLDNIKYATAFPRDRERLTP